MEPIDFVVTWVDGNDPEWRREKQKYMGAVINSGNSANRYREWGTFPYWFRGVEKYAPWVNRVFLVTWGHYPKWLNTANPKLCLVKHTDYIPPECLPTFSSRTIEFFIHKIPELSERFVLFNDDMFLTAPTVPEDFFVNGVPCDEGLLDAINCTDPKDIFPHTLLNNTAVINKHFNKQQVLKKHFSKFINVKYGKDNFRTALMLPLRFFSGFRDLHLPTSFTKSVFEAVWAAEPDIVMNTVKNKFRSKEDINIWLMKNWRVCSGDFVPRSTGWGRKFELGADRDAYKQIRSGKWKSVCVNDSDPDLDFETEKEKLCAAFEALLPEKCSFEL